MDSNHRRQTQQPPADGAGDDWRSQLQYNSRQRIVIKIMDTLKRHLPSSDQQLQQGGQGLWKIAMTLEQKVYHEATSQVDYLRRISLKMLNVESKCNAPGTMSSAILSNSTASSDSNAQIGISELEEEVYLKIKIMEELAELHYSEIHGVYQKVCSKIQQHDSLSLQAKSDGAVMLNSMKDMLERIMQCFQMSRTTAHTFCNDKLRGLEKETISIINSSMPRPPLQQGQILPFLQQNHLPNMMKSAQLNLKLELGRGNAPAETPSTSSDSTAPTNISESQEEMQGMKILYLQEVQGIYQKICLNVKQAEFLSQQAKSDGLVERLKRNLERIIQCLQMSRRTVQPFPKDKLAGLEKYILGVIKSSRRCLELEEDKIVLSL